MTNTFAFTSLSTFSLKLTGEAGSTLGWKKKGAGSVGELEFPAEGQDLCCVMPL